jgi:hypothetical protein
VTGTDILAVIARLHFRFAKTMPQIILGPVVREPLGEPGWYFVVASADQKDARFDKLAAPYQKTCTAFRNGLVMGLAQRPPLVIHDMDDELATARLCEILWPSPKVTKIRADIEAERAANGARS